MISENDIINLLSMAKEAVLQAGNLLSNPPKSIKNIELEAGRDIKIRADKQSERVILNYLRKKTNFSILSEESGLLKGKDSRFIWIVDPLDGSLNYIRGIPFSCVSVGLYQENQPLLGVINDFNNLRLYYGIAGKGAWVNKRKINVSSINKKENAVLCTGFPINLKFSSRDLSSFIQKIMVFKKVRLIGSAALSLAYVASGITDIYIENDIMFWDVAAGLAIISGSGGKYKLQKGSLAYSLRVIASNGLLRTGSF